MTSSPKKILIATPYGFNDRMTNFIEFVTARLLAEYGWDVVAITRSDNKINSVEHASGVTIYRYASTVVGIMRAMYLVVTFRPSIIHFHNQRNNRVGVVIAMIAKLFGIPLLFTEYGLLHDHYLTDDRADPFRVPIKINNVCISVRNCITHIQREPQHFSYFVKNYFFHWPLIHAQWRIFVSQHNIPIAKQLGFTSLLYRAQIADDKRWEIVDANTERDEGSEAVIARINKTSGTASALFVGSMDLRKGWDVLLQAIPFVKRDVVPIFKFVISSSETIPVPMQEMITKLHIADRVIYVGRVNDNELLQKIYRSSTLVVIPSRYEGFGLATIEAFEMHKPIVASSVEALTETLRHGYNALLVPMKNPKKLGEAIEKLALDTQLQQWLIQGGQETLLRVKSNELKTAWLNLYDSVLRGESPADTHSMILPT